MPHTENSRFRLFEDLASVTFKIVRQLLDESVIKMEAVRPRRAKSLWGPCSHGFWRTIHQPLYLVVYSSIQCGLKLFQYAKTEQVSFFTTKQSSLSWYIFPSLLAFSWLIHLMSDTMIFFLVAAERIHKQPASVLLQTVFYSKEHVLDFLKNFETESPCETNHWLLCWIAHECRCSMRRSQRSSVLNGLNRTTQMQLTFRTTVFFLSLNWCIFFQVVGMLLPAPSLRTVIFWQVCLFWHPQYTSLTVPCLAVFVIRLCMGIINFEDFPQSAHE